MNSMISFISKVWNETLSCIFLFFNNTNWCAYVLYNHIQVDYMFFSTKLHSVMSGLLLSTRSVWMVILELYSLACTSQYCKLQVHSYRYTYTKCIQSMSISCNYWVAIVLTHFRLLSWLCFSRHLPMWHYLYTCVNVHISSTIHVSDNY